MIGGGKKKREERREYPITNIQCPLKKERERGDENPITMAITIAMAMEKRGDR